jgi:hypothetical protein
MIGKDSRIIYESKSNSSIDLELVQELVGQKVEKK